MHTNKESIENLLPHRSPFLFVDEILSVTEDEIIGYKTFGEECSWLSGIFPEHNIIPGTILIESLAQCGGAGMRLLKDTNGLFGLASIESATFLKAATFHTPIKYVIKNIRLSDKLVKQSGIAFINDEALLEATWVCVRIS
ncbi:3-hydroxyacyl-ACP dehydratase FabZ family protein [Cytophaga hutchinsonii]|jgi:3-hydroxyacyl-[acyl-carrier-protein] dehydratase|uniref:3-hydroxydecanoyl-[acyl carrier protein] dehydratase n=1 Tax=Cytophaga hutchinsonii (strain ATCC 33406 / DSM 1761 / CIP 103989 / NBRC 15051 / NCIMB 9469 / D465) TaxID=269798 RepID=A0A6N4SPJ3_CYTH3|nr:3-hydroxyacyl-ACP dehydratase FabZ family protein [Cytophaga hutchinsonii]ABG58246.1 3-hydroxydecanoyl-[acyl carrier protein] dehydratase [Cytophaga hutchinsonii ATCC 33406]SFX54129.1 3-hydroxyacyl-[acyl-carrier-protein] dehydratase [Cytophaga hutchinsonii ATCC 33406]